MTQVVPSRQQPLPQQVSVPRQQRPLQHFWVPVQHVSPQHVAVFAQQWFE